MKPFLFLLLVIVFTSCNIVSFDEYSVSMYPESNISWFNGSTIDFYFNCDVKKYYVEKLVTFEKDDSTCEVEYSWKNSHELSIRPKEEWIYGSLYQCELNGTLYEESGESFSVNKICTFYYGNQNNLFLLTEAPFDEINVVQDKIMEFKFNHSVSSVAFEKSFSLSPDVSYRIEIEENNSLYKVIPLSKWEINENYTWSFNNLISNDLWTLSGKKDGHFQIIIDNELPVLEKICAVSSSEKDAEWYTALPLNKNISRKKPIGFIFSKSMNFESVKSNISFSPSISGYFACASEDFKKFLFIPEENYSIETEYLITVDKDIEDQIGLNLFEDFKEVFTSEESYLYIETLKLGETELSPETQTIPELSSIKVNKNLNEKNEFTADILFSTTINEDQLLNCEKLISLSLIFPLTSTAAVKTSTCWSSSRNCISITWENMTTTTDSVETIYLLKVTGGKSGVITGNGNYLKEDLCAYLSFY